ncbi:phage shock envelope stress response protein PspM [Actinoplanes sp. HUAS TT8]|uniref:phage shock envelope stress response protein PspM n=1 Tax=Actinoplanes sp. HUAS TT8 TaxID=3447453 RepID=UPI003F51C68B
MDERGKYFRRLKRLRGSARRWSVLGGGLAAATVVLVPYAGVGIADAAWAAGAGASVVLARWRWRDYRELSSQPAPEPVLPGPRFTAALERTEVGRTVLHEVRRQKNRYALRGSVIAQAWDRLERASATMLGLAGRLDAAGETAALEAATAEQWLRDLGRRVASVERAIPLAQSTQRAGLEQSHGALADQFVEGVEAFEELVAAAASYVAEDGHPVADSRHPAFFGLVEAAERLRGIADGLAELRDQTARFTSTPPRQAQAGSAGTSK